MSERSDNSQTGLTRWIDRLNPFSFDIKHLEGIEMGLINYTSQNPVGLAISPSAFDKKFVMVSNNLFSFNLEMNDNFILNKLADQNRAPYRLIKKRAKTKRTLTSQMISQVHAFKKQTFEKLPFTQSTINTKNREYKTQQLNSESADAIQKN